MSEAPMDTATGDTLAPKTERHVADAADRPFGPAAAVIVAAGIGAFVLGLMTTLNEASTDVHDFLTFDDGVGPLSGKTIFGAGAFFVAWAVLHAVWRAKNPPLRTVLVLAVILLALGVVGTFPTFFQAFASE
jgi:NAD(P)-dependent dehydrogenase (short-subunit alcohol dehydrogenase family)